MMQSSLAAREACQQSLESALLPQDVLSEACLYAIPFLIEMTECSESCSLVYDLLLSICACSMPGSYDQLIRRNGRLESLVVACRRRLQEGQAIFCRDVENQVLSTVCRMNALSVYCRVTEDNSERRGRLGRLLASVVDNDLRAHIESWLQD